MSHTLVTNTCLHYALLPNTPLPSFTATFEHLSEPTTAFSSLKSKPISSHLAIPTICDNFDCFHLTHPEWDSRISTAITQLRRIQTSFREKFLRLGEIYHGIPLHTRLELASDRSCALAHQQFGIETRAWREDVFFQPYRQVRQMVREIERAVAWSVWTDEKLFDIARRINDARALVSKVGGFEREIVAGVTKMQEVYTASVNATMESVNDGNARVLEALEVEREEARLRQIAEARRVREEAAEAEKRRREAERVRVANRRAIERANGERRGVLGLLGRLTGRNRQGLRLVDSPAPKQDQLLQPLIDPRVEAHPEVSEVSMVTTPAPEVQPTAPTAAEISRRDDRDTRRKALLRSAALEVFHSRMQGF
jgi:hypothetical protein